MFGFQQQSSCQYARGQQMQYLDRQDIRCYASWGSQMGVSFLNDFHFTGKGCGGNDMRYEVSLPGVRLLLLPCCSTPAPLPGFITRHVRTYLFKGVGVITGRGARRRKKAERGNTRVTRRDLVPN
jgi:hypothetical protein